MMKRCIVLSYPQLRLNYVSSYILIYYIIIKYADFFIYFYIIHFLHNFCHTFRDLSSNIDLFIYNLIIVFAN